MKPAVFLFLYCQSFVLQAHGTVTDPSGRPVEGAQISCAGQTISTSATGEFDTKTSCEARVEKPGFSAVTTAIDPSKEARITLRLSPRSEQVTVTATGAPLAVEEAGVSATIFTAKDFEPARGPFVQNLLRDVPGLNVVQTGQNGNIVSVFARGGSSSAAMVVLDGVPLTEPGGYYDFAHLTSNGLDRMEVVRGPESSLFGAEASSAVIQIFTRSGDPESVRPHGTVQYERGSFSSDHWTAAVDGGLPKHIDYALTADQFRTTGEFPNDAYRITTGTANLGYAFSDATKLRAVFRTFDSYTGAPGQLYYGLYNLDANNRDRDAAVSVRLDDARGQRYVQRFVAAYHRYRDSFSDPNTESYNVSAALDKEGPRVYFVRLLPANASAVHVTLYPYSSQTYTNRTLVSYQGTLTHARGALVFGYEYQRQAGIISTSDVDRQNSGFFAQEQYALSSRIFLTGGARLEHSSRFGNKFTPRGAVTFRLPTETYLRFSVARGIKEPALIENYARETYYVGNPSLRPEKTTSVEAGLSREWWGRRVHTEASYFRNNFSDLIQFSFAKSPGTWINIDRSRAHGFETSGSLKVTSMATLHASYTKLYTKITKSSNGQYGLELARRARNSGSISLELTPRRWTFVAGTRFVGERQDNDFVFGVNRNPGYEEVFLNASYRVNPHLTPFFRMGNLLDEKYQEALGYQALSRTAFGGLKFTW